MRMITTINIFPVQKYHFSELIKWLDTRGTCLKHQRESCQQVGGRGGCGRSPWWLSWWAMSMLMMLINMIIVVIMQMIIMIKQASRLATGKIWEKWELSPSQNKFFFHSWGIIILLTMMLEVHLHPQNMKTSEGLSRCRWSSWWCWWSSWWCW